MVPRRGTRRYISPFFKAYYSNAFGALFSILDKNVVTFVVTFVVTLALSRGHPQIKPPGSRKPLSLMQMVLLTHLKAGFEKKELFRAVYVGN